MNILKKHDMGSVEAIAEIADTSGFLYPPHGGNRRLASQISGLDPEKILDFSVSVNPLGMPDVVGRWLAESLRSLEEYPDPDCTKLKQTLSDIMGVAPQKMAVTNGSSELISLLPTLFRKGQSLLIAAPCYSEYARAFTLASVPVHTFTLNPSHQFKPDMASLFAKLRDIPDPGGIVLGSPNNPTGTMWDDGDLISLLNYCSQRNIYLIVDETFIDFSGKKHFWLDAAEADRHLILVRSLTKFYAIPGLRIGYGIMAPELVLEIENRRIPWSVNTLAQKVGAELLKCADYARQTRECVERERHSLLQRLRMFESLEIFPASANFILFRLKNGDEPEAAKLYTFLLHRGIVLRNCGNFTGLTPSFFRTAVRNRAENVALLENLEQYCFGKIVD